MLKSARAVNQRLFPQFESLKQGRLAKVFDLYRDYKQVTVDVVQYIKTKPLRFTIYSCTFGGVLYGFYNNPNMATYTDQLLESCNRHSLISDLIRNERSNDYLKELMNYRNQDRLVHWNFGIVSIILAEPYSRFHDKFEKHVSNLKYRWYRPEDWKERIIDVGFLNQWYYLDRIMIDYDVNEKEFETK